MNQWCSMVSRGNPIECLLQNHRHICQGLCFESQRQHGTFTKQSWAMGGRTVPSFYMKWQRVRIAFHSIPSSGCSASCGDHILFWQPCSWVEIPLVPRPMGHWGWEWLSNLIQPPSLLLDRALCEKSKESLCLYFNVFILFPPKMEIEWMMGLGWHIS